MDIWKSTKRILREQCDRIIGWAFKNWNLVSKNVSYVSSLDGSRKETPQEHVISVWPVEKFLPVPGWTEVDLEKFKEKDNNN